MASGRSLVRFLEGKARQATSLLAARNYLIIVTDSPSVMYLEYPVLYILYTLHMIIDIMYNVYNIQSTGYLDSVVCWQYCSNQWLQGSLVGLGLDSVHKLNQKLHRVIFQAPSNGGCCTHTYKSCTAKKTILHAQRILIKLFPTFVDHCRIA